MANRKPFYQQGVYFGKVTKQNLTEAKTGTVQFVLTCKIIAYPDDESGDRVPIEARSQYDRTIFMPLTEKTMEYQVENLKLLGFDKDDLALLDPGVEGFHDFVGDEVQLYCKHEDYNGQPQERWQLSTGRREVITREVDQRAMRNLNTLFGKAKRAAAGGAAKGPQAVQQRSAGYSKPVDDYADQGITDDDIPF